MSGTKDEVTSSQHDSADNSVSVMSNTPDKGVNGTAQSPDKSKKSIEIPNLHCVFDPDGNLVFDLKDKIKTDNGFHIPLTLEAIKKSYDEGSFKTDDSFEIIKSKLLDLLETDFYQMVALLRRTGDLVFGSSKVESLMRHSEVATALVAQDLSSIPSYFNTLSPKRLVQFGDADKYGPIFSRERVVFIGLKKHHLVPILINKIKIIRNLQNS
tara:strand:- start:1136 stop:1771 length:636 start_codon:yes stop_codon:yes gene_type:complete